MERRISVDKIKRAFLAFVELVCLCVAFLLLIPPVPSREGDVYSFFRPHALLAVVLLAVSRQRTARRSGILGWVTLVFYLVAFLVFGWLINYRVFSF